MEAKDIVVIISATGSMLVAVIGALFAGWIAIKQLPDARQKQEEVHALVNRNFTEQQTKINFQQEQIRELQETALAKAEAREMLPKGTD